MNKLLISFLIISLAFAATEEAIRQSIKKVDQTPFGRTLLDTIFLQLEANEPIDRLLETLAELEERYVSDQKEEDEKHRDFQDKCDVDIAAFDKDIAESDTTRIQLEARLEGQLYPTKEILEGIVAQKKAEQAQYEREVKELDTQREEENEDFQAKVVEHEEADAVISEARRIFTEGISAPSGYSVFLQKGKVNSKAFVTIESMALVQKYLLQNAKKAKFNHRKSYTKFFKVLATITSRAPTVAEDGAVQKIITLFDNLLQQIQDSLDLERFAEDKRVESYKKARNLVVISLQTTQIALSDTIVQLNTVKDQIQSTETNLDNTNVRLRNKTEARNDRYQQCEEAAQDYEVSRHARDLDRSVVSETIGLVNAQLRTLREQLALRQAAGENVY